MQRSSEDPDELSEDGLYEESAANSPDSDYDLDPENDSGDPSEMLDGFEVMAGDLSEREYVYLTGSYFEKLVRIDQTRFNLRNILGRTPTDLEIAKNLEVEEFEVQNSNFYIDEVQLTDVEQFEDQVSQILQLAEEFINDRNTYARPLYKFCGEGDYYDFIESLNPIESFALRSSFGLIDGIRKSEAEIARVLGRDPMLIRQALNRATNKYSQIKNQLQFDTDYFDDPDDELDIKSLMGDDSE